MEYERKLKKSLGLQKTTQLFISEYDISYVKKKVHFHLQSETKNKKIIRQLRDQDCFEVCKTPEKKIEI